MSGTAQMTPEEILSRVMAGLMLKRPPCYILEVPPGCEESPDIIGLIQEAISLNADLSGVCASATADSARDDEEFVELLIHEWTHKDPTLKKRWTEEEEDIRDLPTPHRLKAFFSTCIRRTNQKRICVVRRFDRVFRRMSAELLAVLRDLEHELLLITVNASPLPYGELYRRRSRVEKDFTSDYGQIHVRLTIGLHSRESAAKIWTEKNGLPLAERIGTAYFEIAYSLSGGFPASFSVAAECARSMEPLNPDIRVYRQELLEKLPDMFERLLQYDDQEGNENLIEAVSKIHLKSASPMEKQLILSHPWKYLILNEDPREIRLRSQVIGIKALKLIQRERREGKYDPTFLYEQGEYASCCALLEQMGSAYDKLLYDASLMLMEIFGEDPNSLYFGPNIRWGKVKQLAEEASAISQDPDSKDEFDRWKKIGESHESAREERFEDVEGCKKERKYFEKAAIRVGVRIIAVARDLNPVTAAYSAIPLIEEVLRHYVGCVLDLPLNGSAFEGVDAKNIEKWWRKPVPFKFPDKSERLLGSELILLSAEESLRRGKPLFEDASKVARLLGLMDEGRNLLSHYVVTPSERMSRDLVTYASELFNRMCEHGSIGISIKEIETWVKPPKRFLKKGFS